MAFLSPGGVEGDDVGGPDAAQDRDLGLSEVGRDGVAEEADRPASVGGGQVVQVLGRAGLGYQGESK
jgi:hypothetical protein